MRVPPGSALVIEDSGSSGLLTGGELDPVDGTAASPTRPIGVVIHQRGGTIAGHGNARVAVGGPGCRYSGQLRWVIHGNKAAHGNPTDDPA